jgi:hypothetical protein
MTEGEYIWRQANAAQFPADLTPLIWESEIETYHRLFADCQKQLQDTICALESAKAELQKIMAEVL